MDIEPTQLARGMEVDIGMGLGDELGGFEGFDSVFAEPTNTTDFFNFCALEETQQQQDAATTSAFGAPLSPVSSFGQQQRAHDFAQESWNAGGSQQIQGWPSLSLATSEPSRNPMMLTGGKPRARKRHDEDEALEAEESAFPILKRRSSTASMSAGRSPTPEAFEKSHSFGAASGRWTPAAAASKQQQQQGVARHGKKPHPQQGGGVAPPGGAIKVNTDVTSGTVRPPRISVFMSSARRRGGAGGGGGGGAGLPPPSSALPGGHGGSRQHQHQLEPTMDRTASAQAQRLKGLRITMRGQSHSQGQARGLADNYPAVVAMGSPHHPNSTSALLFGDDDAEDQFADATAAPMLRRASSVGALTIAGNGDILSTSPVLSATGTIIQSCELSDRVGGDGGQRRNLVCKVFGSGGSPYMGTSNGGR